MRYMLLIKVEIKGISKSDWEFFINKDDALHQLKEYNKESEKSYGDFIIVEAVILRVEVVYENQ